MAHIPVNHPLRPLYRALAALVGAYVLTFGIVGLTRTWGHPLFDRSSTWALSLRTNLAFSLLSVIVGLAILITALIGGKTGHFANLTAGVVFLVAGIAMMAVLQTSANFLNFSMSTVILSLIFGLLFLITGLYDKVGSADDEEAENRFRRMPVPVRKH